MTLAELEEKLSLMSRSSTCNVEPAEAWQMLAALRQAVLAEREACAQVAETVGVAPASANVIASAIRSRSGAWKVVFR